MKKDPVEVVREHLDRAELLTQLAEEAAELGKAALKLRRAYTGTNPTPVTSREAFENLLEELSDIQICLIVLGFIRPIELRRIEEIGEMKLNRWAGRLEADRAKD